MLRHYWALGNKDRNNHLHHAVDAVILAYTNNAMIKAFANFRKNQEENKKKFYAKQIAESEYKAKKAFFEPCKNFRQMVLDKVDSIFVSNPHAKGQGERCTRRHFILLKNYVMIKNILKIIKWIMVGKRG